VREVSAICCFIVTIIGTVPGRSVLLAQGAAGQKYHLGTVEVVTGSDGQEYGAAPPGAMWDCDWLHCDATVNRYPDGKCWCVRTPKGDWLIDGPSSTHEQGWTRTGEAPYLTVTPSIITPRGYHGWLTEGLLKQC
jgi:hypothetical protein